MPTEKESVFSGTRRKLLKFSFTAAAGGVLLNKVIPDTFAAGQETSAPQWLPPTAQAPIRINFNENALGMSPSAQNAARGAIVKANRYPKDEITGLREQLAAQYHIRGEQLLLTAGSSEGIRATIEAFTQSGAQLVIPELTYGDGEYFAKIAGMKIAKVPCAERWAFDVPAMKEAVARHPGFSLVYLVNPNNPTGMITPADQLEPWIKSRPENTLFIVDEAYAEFVNDPRFRSASPLIGEGYDNMILLKTFSKIHAMAGMRVGYAIADEKIISKVADRVAGEKLNFPGVVAAQTSLQDRAFITYSKKSNDTSRQIYVAALKRLGIDFLPSEGNFVFHKAPQGLAVFQKRMADAHILIGRAFPPATEWCRVSLGTPQEMQYVVSVLDRFHQQGWLS